MFGARSTPPEPANATAINTIASPAPASRSELIGLPRTRTGGVFAPGRDALRGGAVTMDDTVAPRLATLGRLGKGSGLRAISISVCPSGAARGREPTASIGASASWTPAAAAATGT